MVQVLKKVHRQEKFGYAFLPFYVLHERLYQGEGTHLSKASPLSL